MRGPQIYVIDDVRQPNHEHRNGTHPLHVTSLPCHARAVGIDEDNQYRADVGGFEAWICAACGYTEWYAKDFARALELYVAQRGEGVRVVDGTGGRTEPFR